MFHLVNKFGNVHKHVKDARKRDELIAAGYRLAEEPVEVATEDEVKPKKGKAKKNAAEE